MTTYSTRFVATNLAVGWQTVYTAPATGTIVLRDVELANSSGATILYQSQFDGSGVSGVSFRWGEVPSASSVQWEGRVVMNPGDQLLWQAGATGLSLIISGYWLSG